MQYICCLELVQMKSKTNRLETIKSLNLWGNDLDDISIVQQMSSLEVLSLAVNKVTTLRDVQYCGNLRELYMRKNNLASLAEIPKYLGGLVMLRKLSLGENPLAEHPKYRQFVIKALPQIDKLDNDDVSQEERRQLEMVSLEELISASGPGAGEQLQRQVSSEVSSPTKRRPTQQQSPPYDNYPEDTSPTVAMGGVRPGRVQRSPPRATPSQSNWGISPQKDASPSGFPGGQAKVRHSKTLLRW